MRGSDGYVLDASVLVTRVRRREPAYEEVRVLLVALTANNAALYIPTIALAEIAAALSRGGASSDQAIAAVHELRQLPGLSVVGVDIALGNLARDVAARYRIRGCDAVYIALVQRLGVTLITLDRQQRERVPVSVAAFTPAQTLARLS